MKAVAEVLNRKKEMPMASLIDVVFLLLVYFMVTSSLIKKEADLSFQLPLPDQSLSDRAIDLVVEIAPDGEVTIEGERFADGDLLFQRLELLKTVAVASGSKMSVSILPADQTMHGAIISVMDACAAAKVGNLSFNTAM
ncbi:biopolymer transporter ExbD [Pontiellaceae bacterium B12227]|nr:biopolymer transporter ExbD [Pontiellaceae bacterium B12227]